MVCSERWYLTSVASHYCITYVPMIHVCCVLLSGQMIRIWGRIPFQSSGHPPPPIRPDEPYWQRLFQQRMLLHQQQQAVLQKMKGQKRMEQEAILTKSAESGVNSKVQSSAPPPSSQVHPTLGPTSVTTPTAILERAPTVPIATGTEATSIWGTGHSDDSGEHYMGAIAPFGNWPVLYMYVYFFFQVHLHLLMKSNGQTSLAERACGTHPQHAPLHLLPLLTQWLPLATCLHMNDNNRN